MSDFVAGFGQQSVLGAGLARAVAMPRGFAPADFRLPQPRVFTADADRPLETEHVYDEPAVAAIDPVAAAHAEGFAAGFAAATEADGRDRALADHIAAALSGRLDREQVALQLRQTVLFLVSKIVGESGVAPDVLAGRIEAATELLSDTAESAMLRVHPDDVALLDGRLPAMVFAVGDASVARGSFVMESASTVVEDGPELWLEQLAQAIDRVAVPAAGRA